MTRGYFVTGTDTGVGKTRVSLALMSLLQKQGHVVTAMKPVASGCEVTPAGPVNGDALALQAQASFTVPYHAVNPYAFEPPVAPHLAAQAVGVSIRPEIISQALARVTEESDRVVVEGVGGWLVPIDTSRTMADVAVAIGLPVIMVVGVRLGCINHALLTEAAIRATAVPFAGWIANRVEPHVEAADEIVAALRQWLRVPYLGELPCVPEDRPLAEQIGSLSLYEDEAGQADA
jgi:dethiobiotin synthetase